VFPVSLADTNEAIKSYKDGGKTS